MRVKNRTITKLNVYDAHTAIGNREDLANIISMITPEEVPLVSLAKDDKATAVKH